MRFDFKLNVVHEICVFDLMWLCSLVLRYLRFMRVNRFAVCLMQFGFAVLGVYVVCGYAVLKPHQPKVQFLLFMTHAVINHLKAHGIVVLRGYITALVKLLSPGSIHYTEYSPYVVFDLHETTPDFISCT